MPCLLIFVLPQLAARSDYEAFDILQVLPRGTHPGQAVVVGETRFGFLWVDDRQAEDVFFLMQPFQDGVDDEGEPIHTRRRRNRLRGENLPDEGVYRQFRTFRSPGGMHVVWADLQLNLIHDKEGNA